MEETTAVCHESPEKLWRGEEDSGRTYSTRVLLPVWSL